VPRLGLEKAPGAAPPRDIEHLRRQAGLIDSASEGGWEAFPELAIDRGVVRSRSIDIVLLRRAKREAVIAEIWDWFDDVGAALRSIDGKRDALGAYLARLETDPTGDASIVGCLFVVRRTRRNEHLISELRPLFAARFTASAVMWLRALTHSETSLPSGDGLLWATRSMVLQPSPLRVREARRGR
jgi:hypothetical protein